MQNRLKSRKVIDESTTQSLRDMGMLPDGGGAANAHHEHALRVSGKPDVRDVPWEQCFPSPLNPRKVFPHRELTEMGKSMRAVGQIQAAVGRIVSVRDDGSPVIEILVGGKRYRSAGPKYGDLSLFRVDIRKLTDQQARAIILEENAKRGNVTALEFAQGIRDFYEGMENPNWADVEAIVGLSHSSVMRYYALLDVLDLPPEMVAAFYPPEFWEGDKKPFVLGVGQGEALLKLRDFPVKMRELFSEIVSSKMGGDKAIAKAIEMRPGVPAKGRTGSLKKPLRPKTEKVTSAQKANTDRAPWSQGLTVTSTEATPVVEQAALQPTPPTFVPKLRDKFYSLVAEAVTAPVDEKTEFINAIGEFLESLTATAEQGGEQNGG